MSLIDDLKTELEKTSIKKDEINIVLTKISKKYAGQYPYIRINIAKNCRKKSR